MIASTHLAVGAACGVAIHNRTKKISKLWAKFTVLCFIGLAGIVSHLILDTIHHEEYLPYLLEVSSRLVIFVGFEVALMFLLVFSRYNPRGLNWAMFFGMSGAAFPDLIKYIPIRLFSETSDILHLFHAPPNLPFQIPLEWQLIGGLLIVFFYIWPQRKTFNSPD